MTMDDNYIMAENMRQLAEENPQLHRQINILQKKLDIAVEALKKLVNIPYKSPEPYYKDLAKDTLDDIEKIK